MLWLALLPATQEQAVGDPPITLEQCHHLWEEGIAAACCRSPVRWLKGRGRGVTYPDQPFTSVIDDRIDVEQFFLENSQRDVIKDKTYLQRPIRHAPLML